VKKSVVRAKIGKRYIVGEIPESLPVDPEAVRIKLERVAENIKPEGKVYLDLVRHILFQLAHELVVARRILENVRDEQ